MVRTVQKTVLVPQVQFIDVGSSRCELQPKFQRFSTRKSEVAFCPFLRAFFGLRPLGRRVLAFSRLFGEPSMTKSSSSSRAQGWRGRRESDSQFSDSLQRRCHVAIHGHQGTTTTTTLRGPPCRSGGAVYPACPPHMRRRMLWGQDSHLTPEAALPRAVRGKRPTWR